MVRAVENGDSDGIGIAKSSTAELGDDFKFPIKI